MKSALLPCPFCGSKDIDIVRDNSVYCRCLDCGAQGEQCKAKKYAIEMWNTRKGE